MFAAAVTMPLPFELPFDRFLLKYNQIAEIKLISIPVRLLTVETGQRKKPQINLLLNF